MKWGQQEAIMKMAAYVAVAAAALLACANLGHSQPPPNADPALATFFHGLQQPGTGISCCSLADCRSLDASQVRVGPHGWQAFIDPKTFPDAPEAKWIDIPNDKILHGKAHPYGLATMCWMPALGVLCFTEPAGA